MLSDEADVLSAAITHSTGHKLVACCKVDPLPAQERILWDAVARARATGLKLPRRFSVEWKDVPRDSGITDGSTWHLAAGEVRVYLNANMWPDRLREVVYHELQHASDWAFTLGFTRLELEERAVHFAAHMAGYCA